MKMSKYTIDEINSKKPKYSTLTAIKFAGIKIEHTKNWGSKRRQMITCACICGSIRDYLEYTVIRGIKSCGCLRPPPPLKTHGLSNKHRLYRVWDGIKQRCYDTGSPCYHRYGGKGITMCDEWINDFMAFYKWAIANGWKQGLQIDKDIKPLALGIKPFIYSPEMCSIVTPLVNSRNKASTIKLEYNGAMMSIGDLSDLLGIKSSVIWSRLRAGMPIEKILSTINLKRMKKVKLSAKQKEIIGLMRDNWDLYMIKRLHQPNRFELFFNDEISKRVHYQVINSLEKQGILSLTWFEPCQLTRLGKTIDIS